MSEDTAASTRPAWLIAGDLKPFAPLLADIDIIALDCAPADVRDKHAVIWQPADASGQKLALQVAGRIWSAAASLRIVEHSAFDIAASIQRDPELWDADSLMAVAARYGKPVQRAVEKTKAVKKAAENLPAYQLWEHLGLAKNDKGPYATEANALRIIAAHNEYAGRIWLDEFSQRLMIDTEDGAVQFSRTHAVEILIWMQESLQLPKMPLSAVERAAGVMGERNKRHPVKQWLESITWDGVDRLQDLLPHGFGTVSNDYTRAVGRCWLVAMISRIYNPGGQADNVPVFEGSQGLRKSSALRALVGEEWFLESIRNPIRDPDKFSQSLQGKWLVEIPEIDRVGGKHGSLLDLIAIITIRKDTYRQPYAPTFMDYPRQTILAGTTNASADSGGWNPDQTGGRRFWPVACTAVDIEWITESRDQLFAEALHRYQRGEAWWDVPEAEAKAEQESRRIADEWEELIERYINEGCDRSQPGATQWYPRAEPLESLTVLDIMLNCLGVPEARCDRGIQMRVAQCLQRLGWEKYRASVGGKRQNTYRKVLRQ